MLKTVRTEAGSRLRRWTGAAGAAGLAALALAYWLTIEPAPRVRVLWRDDVRPPQQVTLEQKYLLVNGRDRMASGSVAYDLLDTSSRNIQALVEDPAISDTNDIDRSTFVVRFDVEYGERWMWIAHRTPGLRAGWARAVFTILLAAMAVWGLSPAVVAHRKQGQPSGPNFPVG